MHKVTINVQQFMHIHVHMHSLNLLLESSVKELDEQVLFPVILSVVEHRQNHILHEPIGSVLGHLKD